MKKRLIYFLFFLLFFTVTPSKAFSEAPQDNFLLRTRASYAVTETGLTNVKETITITNKKEFIYTPSYSITITNGDISNIGVSGANGSIPFTLKEKSDGSREVEANFTDRVVGIDKSFTFTISFSALGFARKNGNTWEVNIPGLVDPTSYEDYTVVLSVPKSFGEATILKPPVLQSGSRTLTFTRSELGTSGIFILFGNTEYYKGQFTYHIENLNLFPVRTEVALPLDTNYQSVLIKDITPAPDNVYRDQDGNWLATYFLVPHSKKDISLGALFKILAKPQKALLSDSERKKYTASTTYWEADSASIKKLADTLKTPQEIYNYVVKTLTYNYDKVNSNNLRLGAVKSLTNPTYAVCLEFTDLFVALARSAGIPARAVEGYAYTQGDKLRPVSLVKDVLHAWPEYYDDNSQTWIMIDPTWGNTTRGMDYFTSLDFEHIAFVIKGVKSTYPVPAGGYKVAEDSRDIDIKFADASEFNPTTNSKITFLAPKFPIPWVNLIGSVKITNTGNVKLPAQKMDVRSSVTDGMYAYSIPEIPPFGYKEIQLDIGAWNPTLTNLLTKRDAAITISYNANTISQKFSLNGISILIIGITGGVLLVIIGTITTIAATTRRIPFQK